MLVTVIAGAVGALWAGAERRPHPTRPHAGFARVTGALLVALALGAAVVALAAMDDPTGKLSDTWTEFKQGYSDEPPSERVALHERRIEPLRLLDGRVARLRGRAGCAGSERRTSSVST